MKELTTIVYLFFFGLPVIVFLIIRPVYAILLMGCIYPLIFIAKGDIGYVVFMNGYRFLFIVAFIGWILRLMSKKSSFSLFKLEYFIALLLIGSLIVALKTGEFVNESIQGIAFFKYIVYAGMAIMIPNLLDSEDQINQFLTLFLVSTSFISILGIIQYTTGATLLYDMDTQLAAYSPSSRLFFGKNTNPNAVAIMQLMALCCLICHFYYGKLFKALHKQSMLIIMLLSILVSMLLGQSRSALVALVFSVGITLIIVRGKKMRSIFIFIALLLIGYGLFLQTANKYFEERLNYETIAGGDLQYRFIQMRAALSLILDDPLGVGGEYGGLLFRYGGIAYASTHNIFLKIMMDTGLIGFFGYFAIIISVLSWLIRLCRKNFDMRQRILLASLLSAMMSFLIQAQAHHILWEYPFWMFVGLSLYFKKIKMNSDPKVLVSSKPIRPGIFSLQQHGAVE